MVENEFINFSSLFVNVVRVCSFIRECIRELRNYFDQITNYNTLESCQSLVAQYPETTTGEERERESKQMYLPHSAYPIGSLAMHCLSRLVCTFQLLQLYIAYIAYEYIAYIIIYTYYNYILFVSNKCLRKYINCICKS